MVRNRYGLVGLVMAGVVALLVAGCPKRCVEPVEPVPPPPPAGSVVEEPLAPESPASSVTGLQPVYFDFDRSEIRPGDAVVMQNNAAAIKGMSGSPTVTIEGHCDPVGTSEYNMALGMRRAEAAKAYLVKLGVPATQLSTVSYGEERLVTQNEAEYQLNRRVEFKVAR